MKKFILLAIMTLSGLSAFAYDAKIDGIYYNFSGSEATVTYGSTNYSGAVVIPKSVTYEGNTYNVTSIGNNAFNNCYSMTFITIPNSVISIRSYAFCNCTGLTSVTIPNSVTSIEFDAFRECSGLQQVIIPDIAAFCGISFGNNNSNPLSYAKHLFSNEMSEIKNLVIPEGVTSLGNFAFYNCNYITSVSIPNSVNSIGERVFQGCGSLAFVNIPESVTSIGYYTFGGCYFVTNSFANYSTQESNNNWGATLCDEETSDGLLIKDRTIVKSRPWVIIAMVPNSVTSIGAESFSGCSRLTSVIIPNSITSIGYRAFRDCSSLTSIYIPKSVTSIAEEAFSYCCDLLSIIIEEGNEMYDSRDNCNAIIETSRNELVIGCKNTIIPKSVTSIAGYAFEGCRKLTTITIPNNVTSIGWWAFRDCSNLTSIAIGNGVLGVGMHSFEGCINLTSVIIGKSVTSIAYYAFYDCKLVNLIIKSVNPPVFSAETFSEQTLYHTTLYVPIGSWLTYAYDDNWYKFHNIRETATTEEQLFTQQAYTLMDANTFAYSVYDPVNDCIGTISFVSGINEDNPNHSWQVIEAGGARYLYNIGAKKYVRKNGNSFDFTDTPEPIEVEDGDNGIILGAQPAQQWVLVSNEHMSVAQSAIDEVTAIISPIGETDEGAAYNLAGQRINKPQKGINIIGDKKVMIK